jgi:hypothetical protein
MPAQQRARRHQQHSPRRARQVTGRSRQQRPVSRAELRPCNLSAQDLELVPQYQQLDLFHVEAAAAPNKRTEETPNGEVEEKKGHAVDPRKPSRGATRILAPFRGAPNATNLAAGHNRNP